jgi:selenocysteine-specific translation elongation factor
MKRLFSLQAKRNLRTVQVTLVDCPGHASLIRTVIGGAQIIDICMLVIDAVKGEDLHSHLIELQLRRSSNTNR